MRLKVEIPNNKDDVRPTFGTISRLAIIQPDICGTGLGEASVDLVLRRS